MILNSTKFGGNRTKDVEVGPDRRTDRKTDMPIPIYPPNYVWGGYNKQTQKQQRQKACRWTYTCLGLGNAEKCALIGYRRV